MIERTTDILFCGTGGQGILKASEICAVAAMLSGFHSKKTEVHGMAQRGGSVESHVRYGKKVFSPLTLPGGVDFLVPLDLSESEKMSRELKKTGKNLVEYLKISGELLENGFFLNTFMVGALSKYLSLSEKNWVKAVRQVFDGKHLDANIEVFMKGRDAVI